LTKIRDLRWIAHPEQFEVVVMELTTERVEAFKDLELSLKDVLDEVDSTICGEAQEISVEYLSR
jgi:hypothetical protein